MKDLVELLNKIDAKIDQRHDLLEQRMDNLEIKAETNNVMWNEHMRRTEIAEQSITDLRRDIAPLQRTNTKLHFTVKAVPWMLGIGAIIVSVLEYLKD